MRRRTKAPAPRTTRPADAVEWQTLALLLACYGVWALATTVLAAVSVSAAVLVCALALALHSSLSHEVLHGHPTRSKRLNEWLVFPALGLFIPYGRFRETHLAHHRDSMLTDPHDDPESNYLDPVVWARLPGPARAALRANNTLIGRMLIGPVLSVAALITGDIWLIRAGARHVAASWGWHMAGLVPVAAWLSLVGMMPAWSYFLAAYLGLAILKIRTFLEHRARAFSRERTVIVEDRGPLAFLFLNNNLHAVHHLHPGVAWYRLPALYRADRARFLAGNGGYLYRSYAEVFRRYLLRAKDPVAHPGP